LGARARYEFAEESQDLSNTYTAIFERDGGWYIAYCPEVPGANGQGSTKDEARESLAAAIELILSDRREDALRGLPADAEKDTVTVG
jgi:predicted RNase H-like HicB family nuclease